MCAHTNIRSSALSHPVLTRICLRLHPAGVTVSSVTNLLITPFCVLSTSAQFLWEKNPTLFLNVFLEIYCCCLCAIYCIICIFFNVLCHSTPYSLPTRSTTPNWHISFLLKTLSHTPPQTNRGALRVLFQCVLLSENCSTLSLIPSGKFSPQRE